MKVAYHFNSAFPGLGNPCTPQLERILFSNILGERRVRLATKVYMGIFPLYVLSPDAETYEKALKLWRAQALNGWRRFTKRMENFGQTDVFVICFESVGTEFAAMLHRRLASEECYLGAIQVDDAAKIHWELYSDALQLTYRISDRNIAWLYDETSGDEPTEDEEEEKTKWLMDLGFEKVSFEETHGKHTFFDKYHSFAHARRVAEWKARFGDLLGFMADEVVCRLGDHIPELTDKLYAAINTYDAAETDEEYAQVSASCRRILEFTADRLFPPTDEERNGHKLGPKNYRNRLVAFVEDQTKSKTHVKLITSSLDLFAQHVEKLQDLANKGIHSEIQREGARRALLRTVFILDDIVALRPESFPIKPEIDMDFLDGKGPSTPA
jgi:hypothetical protein